ncbi:MAG: chemotaxis protein CheW [Acidimicrobiia bacterium]
MSDELAYCTFRLGELFFGVEVLSVQEVIRYQRMTAVPLAPAVVSGLINLRGQVVTAIDLRRRLGMPDRAEGQLPMNVVVRTEDGPVSLLVDEIGDVLEVDESMFEPAPETLEGVTRDLVTGVFKLDGRLLLVLDVDRALRLPVTAGSEIGG